MAVGWVDSQIRWYPKNEKEQSSMAVFRMRCRVGHHVASTRRVGLKHQYLCLCFGDVADYARSYLRAGDKIIIYATQILDRQFSKQFACDHCGKEITRQVSNMQLAVSNLFGPLLGPDSKLVEAGITPDKLRQLFDKLSLPIGDYIDEGEEVRK